MKIVLKETILVNKESYLFLQNKGRTERSGKDFSDEFKKKLAENFDRQQYKGYVKLSSGLLGGKENGEITSWSCKKMAEILDNENLEYKFGEEAEYIEL